MPVAPTVRAGYHGAGAGAHVAGVEKHIEAYGCGYVDYLVALGVFRERERDRVDAPDNYLFGLGLRRRGGVQAGRVPRARQAAGRGGEPVSAEVPAERDGPDLLGRRKRTQ